MKRLSSMFLAVAMMVGAFASTGCAKPSALVEAPESPAAAPVNTTPAASDATAAKTDESVNVSASAQVQVPAPPPVRVESPGRAPSARHRFQPGFWRYDGPRAGYVWVPGHWELIGAAPMAPPPPRFEQPGCAPSAAYAYVPGYWSYDGREFVWISGHWSLRADVGRYYSSEYVLVNGRYERRFDRWDDARFAARERMEQERRERAERDARERAERDARERAERVAKEQAQRDAEQAKNGHADHPAGTGSHGHPNGTHGREDKPAGESGHVKPAKPIVEVAGTTAVKHAATPAVLNPKKPANRSRG